MRKYRQNPLIFRVAGMAVLGASLLLTACAHRAVKAPAVLEPSSWHLPWHRKAAPEPVAVQELTVQSEVTQAGSVKQYWTRNTLRIDLTRLSGSGTLTLQPNAVNGWPARIEFAVRTGSISQLEVQGDQRTVFAVSVVTGDGAQQTLPLSPSAYSAATQLLSVSWN